MTNLIEYKDLQRQHEWILSTLENLKSTNKQLEYGDSSRHEQRVISAKCSLDTWYYKTLNELAKEDSDLAVKSAKEYDITRREEIELKRSKIKEKIDQINSGMRLCELAKVNSSDRKEKHNLFSGVEQRSAMTSPSTYVDNYQDTDTERKKKLSGLAAVYELKTVIAGLFEESIKQGAFDKCLKRNPDTKFLFNHNPDIVLGRSLNGSLRMYSTKAGLAFWCTLLSNDLLSDGLYERIKRKDISQCSFAFTVASDFWKLPSERGQLPHRIILEISDLMDCSAVTFPAYGDTIVEAFEEKSKEEKHREDLYAFLDDPDPIAEKMDREAAFEKKFEVEKKYRKCLRIIARNKTA